MCLFYTACSYVLLLTTPFMYFTSPLYSLVLTIIHFLLWDAHVCLNKELFLVVVLPNLKETNIHLFRNKKFKIVKL